MGTSPIRAARLYAEAGKRNHRTVRECILLKTLKCALTIRLCADLALLEAAVAIAIPVQELHSTEEPKPEASGRESFRTADNTLSDSCRPAHQILGGVKDEHCCSNKSCGSAQSIPRMTEQTGPFTDLILFAEQDGALDNAEPVLSPPQAALDQDRHAGIRPSVDQLTGDDAESVLAHRYLSPPVMEAAEQQPASSSLLQRGSTDQQALPSHQEATHAADSASDLRLEAGQQAKTSAPSPDEPCKVTAHSEAAGGGHSPRQSQSKEAVLSASGSTPVSAEPASAHSGHLLVPPEPPRQEAKAGASTTEQQPETVCVAEALGLAGDAIVSLELSEALSRAGSSGHSSPAATSAHSAPAGHMRMSQPSAQMESIEQVFLSPAPVQRLGGDGKSSQPAAQACPSAITPQTAGSERASFPALAEVWGATSHLEGVVSTQTAICSPKTPPPGNGVLQAAAKQLYCQVSITRDCLDNGDEGRSDIPNVVDLVIQQLTTLRHSGEDPRSSTMMGPYKQSDQALSLDLPHSNVDTMPQSTSLAHNEHLGQTAEVAQENVDSLQRSDILTCASQQLTFARHDVQTPSGTAKAGQFCPTYSSVLTERSAVPTVRLNPASSAWDKSMCACHTGVGSSGAPARSKLTPGPPSVEHLAQMLSGKYSLSQMQCASPCIASISCLCWTSVHPFSGSLEMSVCQCLWCCERCELTLAFCCPGLEAKYGGLPVTDHGGQPQGASEMSSSSDAAQPSESSDGMPVDVEVSRDEEACTRSPSHSHGQREMGGETEQDDNHGRVECDTEARHDTEASACSGTSHSTNSVTDESYDRRSSASSMATALAADAASPDEGSESDWAACAQACKGRLNRMLLGCGMPSLPCQV